MKKIVSVVLVCVLLLSVFAACGKKGESSSYSNLTYTASLNSEEYGVGFRKGSDLTAALNDFFAASYADGTSKTIAEKYNIQDKLIDFVASASNEIAADSDLEYVKGKGTLIVGITDFAPMDYKENGEWIGFDADMAKAFAESLGVKVEFVEIDWDNKLLELNDKKVDCIWNGMTLTDEVLSSMSCSGAYFNNAQVVIVKKDVADQYKTPEDCKQLKFAVEAGSAGEEQAQEYGFDYTAVQTQADALMEVAAGTSDAAIIDYLMASAMVG